MNTTKNLTFTKPEFNEQECTLMLGQSIGSNVRSSLRHAYAIAMRPKQNNVLYINTVQTDRKLSESVHEVLGESRIPAGDISLNASRVMTVLNSEIGELHTLKDKITGMIWERGINTVIINSWDFAADGSRNREKMIFLIKYLLRGNWGEESKVKFIRKIRKKPKFSFRQPTPHYRLRKYPLLRSKSFAPRPNLYRSSQFI